MPYKPVIDQILRDDLDAPRKQQHTVKRIFDRLVAEHGAVEVTYPRATWSWTAAAPSCCSRS